MRKPRKKAGLTEAAEVCGKLCERAPQTFREALQLVWLADISLCAEGRYAMALGRMDQYLFPFYCSDIAANRITREQAEEMLACTLYKIAEGRIFRRIIASVRPRRLLTGNKVFNAANHAVVSAILKMDAFMQALEEQMRCGMDAHMMWFLNYNNRLNPNISKLRKRYQLFIKHHLFYRRK